MSMVACTWLNRDKKQQTIVFCADMLIIVGQQ